ncbi:MAG: hypothetical protein JSS51_11690 [Planctomycetes bacterium]|nr:hypothetical protein [Planctomycetota bacterium]
MQHQSALRQPLWLLLVALHATLLCFATSTKAASLPSDNQASAILQNWAKSHASAKCLEINWISEGMPTETPAGQPILRYTMEKLKYRGIEDTLVEHFTVEKPFVRVPAPQLQAADFEKAPNRGKVSETPTTTSCFGFGDGGINAYPTPTSTTRALEGAFRSPWIVALWLLKNPDDSLCKAAMRGSDEVVVSIADTVTITLQHAGDTWNCIEIKRNRPDGTFTWSVSFSDFRSVPGITAKLPFQRAERRLDSATAKAMLAGKDVPVVLGAPSDRFASGVRVLAELPDEAFVLSPEDAKSAEAAARDDLRKKARDAAPKKIQN